MIFGIVHRQKDNVVNKDRFLGLLPEATAEQPTNFFMERQVAMGVSETGVDTVDRGVSIAYNHDKSLVVAASGNVFADHNSGGGKTSPNDTTAARIMAAYQQRQEASFAKLNGQYSAAIWDSSRGKFILTRDHVGFEPLFYYWDNDTLIFSSSFRSLLRDKQIREQINFRAIRNYLLFNYNPGLDTFVQNVHKIQTGHYLELDGDQLQTKKYWQLSYQNQNGRKVEDYTAELLELTKDAIKIRADVSDSDPGAFLSGGMDSSSVVGLLHGLTDKPTHTFSFRCADKSVDESHFARVMAKHYQTQHTEVQFTAEELSYMEEMTRWMDEPLCDIGVELGSFILGRAAKGQVKYILTGDGGDELYGGHPVYVADQMAEKFDKLPAPIRLGITKTAQLLPDSTKKKSLLVKTRRFAYSYEFPRELLSNRWRIYYNDNELLHLFNPEFSTAFGELGSYADITNLYADADGPDLLSRSLYGDYQTLVHFHVDRLRLTRASGIEARFPLHDYRLIEFSATIPSALKIKGSQVKWIQKKALTGVLPDEIVFRKDKMGHNVPMKNWMREAPLFRELMQDVLSDSAVKKRGYFNPEFIQFMLDNHLKKKKDYSHRLYALLVLELWFQHNIDN